MSRFGLGFIGGRPDISLIGFTSKVNSSSSTSLVLDLPSGVQAGDLLVAMYCSSAAATRTWTPAAGWTEMLESASAANLGVSWLVAGSSEPSNYTMTLSGSQLLGGTIFAFRNAAFDVIGAPASSGSVPGVTLSGDDSVLLAFSATNKNGSTISTPSGMSQIVFQNSLAPSFAVSSQDKVAAGATGSKTLTFSDSGQSVLIGIKRA